MVFVIVLLLVCVAVFVVHKIGRSKPEKRKRGKPIKKRRDTGPNALRDEIHSFEWSAILDPSTCEECAALDKKVFLEDNPNLDLISPPLHPGCRCVLVPITRDEATIEQPEISKLTRSEALRISKKKVEA